MVRKHNIKYYKLYYINIYKAKRKWLKLGTENNKIYKVKAKNIDMTEISSD